MKCKKCDNEMIWIRDEELSTGVISKYMCSDIECNEYINIDINVSNKKVTRYYIQKERMMNVILLNMVYCP